MRRLLCCTLLLFAGACGSKDAGNGQAAAEAGSAGGQVAAAFEEVGETGVRELKDGLIVETTTAGSGRPAEIGNALTIHYKGMVKESGEVFDSTYGSGIPHTFTLGAKTVLPAWEIGLLGARAGADVKMQVPAALAYGSEGMGRVPPDAALEFEIHVVKVD